MTPAESRGEVHVLLAKVEQTDDPRFAVRLVRERIAELNNCGEEVPEELTWMEKRLVAECIDASQGR